MQNIALITEQVLNTDPRLAIPLRELADSGKITTRCVHALQGNEIFYTGEAIAHTDAELLRMPNFGKVSLDSLREAMTELGLKLGTRVHESLMDNYSIKQKEIQTILGEREAAAVTKYRAGTLLSQSPVDTSLADNPLMTAVTQAIADSRIEAWRKTGSLLVRASREIDSTFIGKTQELNANQDPLLSVVAKAMDDSRYAAFVEAAKLISQIGQRFADPRFQEILAEGIQRHDLERGTKPGDTDPK